MALVSSGTPSSYTVTYTYTITNSGDITLTDVILIDAPSKDDAQRWGDALYREALAEDDTHNFIQQFSFCGALVSRPACSFNFFRAGLETSAPED